MNHAVLKGIPAAGGLAVGRASLWYHAAAPPGGGPATDAAPAGPPTDAALTRFREAVRQVSAELAALARSLAERADARAAEILEAHALMAGDPELEELVAAHLDAGRPLAEAVRLAADELADALRALSDPYLQERAADVHDVAAKLLGALGAGPRGPAIPFGETIVVAREIPPSVLAQLDSGRVRAILTEEGGATSHAALMAKSLGIPAVMGCGPSLAEAVAEGDWLAVDASAGEIHVRPGDATMAAFRVRLAAEHERAARQSEQKDRPAVTAAGQRIVVMANVGGERDARAALAAGAEGVGLFRTEFLFLDRNTLPDEEEQYRAYKAVVEMMAPRPVVIRTLDIGGDKPLPALPLPAEENPFLGWRGIRLWLERPDLAVPQARALLRAARYGELHILLPMVTRVEELRAAQALFAQVRAELGEAAGPVKVGVMIEVPAAALTAESLAPECDFFSIGTNDLVQYTMAADRGNPKVAALQDPLHPAVLRLIEMTVAAAHAHGKPVCVCGDAAAEPGVIPHLVAAGVDELSMPAGAIGMAKEVIGGL